MSKRILFFGAERCHPCKYMEEVVDQIGKTKDIDVHKYDIVGQKGSKVASFLNVNAIPYTIIADSDDEDSVTQDDVKGRAIGMVTKKEITRYI